MSSDLKLGVWGCKPGPRTLLALLFSSLLLGCASLPRPLRRRCPHRKGRSSWPGCSSGRGSVPRW